MTFWIEDEAPVEVVETTNTEEVVVEQEDKPNEPEATQTRRFKVKVDQEELEVDEDELIKGYSRQSDYTRKSQALAEERKAIELAKQEVEQLKLRVIEEDEEALANKVQLKEVSKILNQAKDIDWSTWFNTDSPKATQAFAEYNQYQALHKQLAESLSTREQEQATLAEQARVMDFQKAKAEVVNKIPDFDSIKGKLVDTGLSIGFTAKELDAVTDWRMIKVLKDAMLWNEYQTSKTNKPTSKPEVTTGNSKLMSGVSKIDATLSKLF